MSKRTRKKRDRHQRRQSQNGVGDRKRSGSQPIIRTQSPSPARQAVEACEQFDVYAGLRNGLRHVAAEKGEWAGIPIPLSGERLVLEPSYPFAKGWDAINEATAIPSERLAPAFDPPRVGKERNTFYSDRRRCTIHIFDLDGKPTFGIRPGVHHLLHDMTTLGCADAWGVEQESNAVHLLGELVSHRQFKQYMLTGMFLESSPRSRLTYLFRRLKPTVALTTRSGEVRILCSLCMHPIGYYDGSWAGAMCPTDDVIAHLSLMRADEHMFWKRSGQHEAHRPEAGL